MASKSHNKIQTILQEAKLPPKLSEELRRELESHFYEKELDLRFKGVQEKHIQKQLDQDFGNKKVVASTLQLVHTSSFYSFIKLYMKKLFISLAVIFFVFAFSAPWFWMDNGEDLLETKFFLTGRDEVFSKPRDRIPVSPLVNEDLLNNLEKMCYCDGSCMRVDWVPFGAKVIGCADDYYFVSFWGQRFHMNN